MYSLAILINIKDNQSNSQNIDEILQSGLIERIVKLLCDNNGEI